MRIEGATTARLTGGDYAAIRATITGERITPLGQWTEWIAAGAGRTGKPSEPGQPDMTSGITPAVVLQGPRWWARGALSDQAAVELLRRHRAPPSGRADGSR